MKHLFGCLPLTDAVELNGDEERPSANVAASLFPAQLPNVHLASARPLPFFLQICVVLWFVGDEQTCSPAAPRRGEVHRVSLRTINDCVAQIDTNHSVEESERYTGVICTPAQFASAVGFAVNIRVSGIQRWPSAFRVREKHVFDARSRSGRGLGVLTH
jgi:hypothetical protein